MQTVVFCQLYGGRSCLLLSPTDVKKKPNKQTNKKTIESLSQKLCLILCVLKLLIRLFRYGFANDFPNQAWVTLFYVNFIAETLYRFSSPNEILYLVPKGFKSWPVMRLLTSESLPVRLIPSDDALFNLTINTRMAFVFEFDRFYRCMLIQTSDKEIIKVVHLLIHSH